MPLVTVMPLSIVQPIGVALKPLKTEIFVGFAGSGSHASPTPSGVVSVVSACVGFAVPASCHIRRRPRRHPRRSARCSRRRDSCRRHRRCRRHRDRPARHRVRRAAARRPRSRRSRRRRPSTCARRCRSPASTRRPPARAVGAALRAGRWRRGCSSPRDTQPRSGHARPELYVTRGRDGGRSPDLGVGVARGGRRCRCRASACAPTRRAPRPRELRIAVVREVIEDDIVADERERPFERVRSPCGATDPR